jgi:hypothetical protein
MSRCSCTECIGPAEANGPSFCKVHAAIACGNLECGAHAACEPARARAIALELTRVRGELSRARSELAHATSEGPTAAELVGAWSVEVRRAGGGRAWFVQRSEGEARELYARAIASAETCTAVLRGASGGRVEEWDR